MMAFALMLFAKVGARCWNYWIGKPNPAPNYLTPWFDDFEDVVVNISDDINERDHFGRTTLHRCCKYNVMDYKMAALLIKMGANIKEVDLEGNTPFQYFLIQYLPLPRRPPIKQCDRHYELLKLFIKNGADISNLWMVLQKCRRTHSGNYCDLSPKINELIDKCKHRQTLEEWRPHNHNGQPVDFQKAMHTLVNLAKTYNYKKLNQIIR